MGAGVSCFDAPLAGPPFPAGLASASRIPQVSGEWDLSSGSHLAFPGDFFSRIWIFPVVSFLFAVSSSARNGIS